MVNLPGVSSSKTSISKYDGLDNTYHFRWTSISNYMYIFFVYASNPTNFDVFTTTHKDPVTLFNFTAMAITIGMSYMCVDLFIKQFTRRLDSDKFLSPVLKGLTASLMLQNAYHSLTHIRQLGDGTRFFLTSMSSKPMWSVCPEDLNDTQCMNIQKVLQFCGKQDLGGRISINATSAHINYKKMFYNYDRGLITWRFVVSAVVWILNFCISTIPDNIGILIKLYKYILYFKCICSGLTFGYLGISTGRTMQAFLQLMDINVNSSINHASNDVALIYGIGIIGVYDLGTTSQYTMVDNVVLIFTVFYIALAAVRSMIAKIILLVLTDCVEIGSSVTWHYEFFVLLPYGTEFLYTQKLITMYLYGHLILSLLPYLMLYTVTTTKILHSEFPSIKTTYIVGGICVVGTCFSMPTLLIDQRPFEILQELFYEHSITHFFLGGCRMSIIMWVYGVNKFATDIRFWLGFNPTKFWIVLWSVLPIVLFVGFGFKVYCLINTNDMVLISSSLTWFIISVVIMLILQTKIIVNYLLNNNLSGAFRSDKRYGPPDKEDRKKRRKFDLATAQRRCFHTCIPLDEEVDCNHLPLMQTREGAPGSDSENSPNQNNTYEAESRTQSVVSVLDKSNTWSK